MLAIQMYLLFASGNGVADRMTGLENTERRRPEEKEGKDSSEDAPEPFITCKEWKELIKDVFKELKKDKLLEGSKIKSLEVCEVEGKYSEDGPLHEHAKSSCTVLDDPYFTVCEREFPDLMAKWCMEEVWYGDGAFEEKEAEEFIGCGNGDEYSLYRFGQVPVVLEREARAARSIPKTIRSSYGQADALMLIYFQRCYNNPSTPQCEAILEMLSMLLSPSESRFERAKRTTSEEELRRGSPTELWERTPSQPSQKDVLRVCQKKGRNSAECQMLLAEMPGLAEILSQLLPQDQLYKMKRYRSAQPALYK